MAVGDNITTTSQVDHAVNNYYDRKLLTRARPKLLAMDFGQVRNLPANSTDTIKFRKYGSLTAATTALSEGVNPDGSQLSVTDITATPLQYGDYVMLTDKVQLIVEDNVLNEATDILADQMAETLDTLTFSVLKAGTNVFYANAAANRAALASAITAADIDKAIRMMRRNNAMEYTSMIKAGTGVGTFPIRPAFWAFVHPDVVRDLENIDGFISAERYSSTGPCHEAEVGAYKNVRFLMTTQAPYVDDSGNPAHSDTYVACDTNTTKANVYQTIILAKEAYGITNIERGNVKSILKTPGAQSTNDPLNMRSSIGWKTWFVAKILQDSWMCRIESLATV